MTDECVTYSIRLSEFVCLYIFNSSLCGHSIYASLCVCACVCVHNGRVAYKWVDKYCIAYTSKEKKSRCIINVVSRLRETFVQNSQLICKLLLQLLLLSDPPQQIIKIIMPENVRKRWLSMNTYGKPITRTTVKCYIEGS